MKSQQNEKYTAAPDKLVVKKLNKKNNHQNYDEFGLGLNMPEISNNAAVVYLVGENIKGLSPGDKIYHGHKVESLRMKGEDVLVMEYDNVFVKINYED